VDIVHVIETDVIEELAIDVETLDVARDVVADNIGRLDSAGITATGHLLPVISDHGGAGRRIAEYANDHQARMILIGTPTDSEIAGIFDAALTSQVVRHAHCAVHIIPSGYDRVPLGAAHAATGASGT